MTVVGPGVSALEKKEGQALMEEFSHELRTPLTSLSNNIARLGLCLSRGGSTSVAEFAESVAKVEGEALRDVDRLTAALDRLLPRGTPFNVLEAERRAVEAAHVAQHYTEIIFDTVRSPLVVLSDLGRVVSANRAFYRRFHLGPTSIEGRALSEIGDEARELRVLGAFLEKVLRERFQIDDHEVRDPLTGSLLFFANARRVEDIGGNIVIFLSIEDTAARAGSSRLDA